VLPSRLAASRYDGDQDPGALPGSSGMACQARSRRMKASKARGVARLDRIRAVLGAALRARNCSLTVRGGWFRGLACDGQYPVPDVSHSNILRSASHASRSKVFRVDRQRIGRRCRRKSAAARVTENAIAGRRRVRTELRNQRSSQAALPLETAATVGAVEAHHPYRPGMPRVLRNTRRLSTR